MTAGDLDTGPVTVQLLGLADFLADNRDEVLRRWASAVLRDGDLPEAARLSHDELIDNLPYVLTVLDIELRSYGTDKTPTDALTGSHGHERFRQGYDFDELIREFGLLRLTLADVVSEYRRATGALGTGAVEAAHAAITRVINEATAESARRYSDARKAIERELQTANERLAAQDAVKSRFISTVAHELRSPLNVIAGVSQIFVRTRDSLGELARLADMLNRNVDGLVHLLDDLLDYSRLAAGKDTVNLASVDPAALVDRLAEGLRAEALRKGLELRVEHGSAPRSVTTDPVKLTQILTNLVSNAIKFTERGTVAVRVAASAGRCTVEVADTGPGIEPQNIERVFEEFVRVGSTPDGARGTGLGLPIARRLAETLGGTIDVSSTPGAGSTFTLTIPLQATSRSR